MYIEDTSPPPASNFVSKAPFSVVFVPGLGLVAMTIAAAAALSVELKAPKKL